MKVLEDKNNEFLPYQEEGLCATCGREGELGCCFIKPTEVRNKKVTKCTGYRNLHKELSL